MKKPTESKAFDALASKLVKVPKKELAREIRKAKHRRKRRKKQ